jgi:dextranase
MTLAEAGMETPNVTFELLDVWPERATYHPGEPVVLHVEVAYQGGVGDVAAPIALDLDMQLTWLHDVVAEWSHPVAIAPGRTVLAVPVPPPIPVTPFRGYGIMVAVRDSTGHKLAAGSSAVDVLETWAQSPRYGFLVDFAPDDPQAEEHVAFLARYHINVVQFYDWMWRHYALMPPTDMADTYVDALGRVLSLRTVRSKVAACHKRGMAALGYAAVYGAEPEYAQEHPDEVVYDAKAKPYWLGDLFAIMNIHTGNPWRERILATMREAVRDVPFDGLHLDQYGFPVEAAFDLHGEPCDVPADFAAFVNDARAAIQQPERDVGVIFNAVRNWPIEQVAPTDQDAIYIEVWPPYEEFHHLQQLITEAQRLAPEKQVILAAYMQPLGGAIGDQQSQSERGASLAQAEAATRFTSAAIWSNGGFHLLLGERDAALHEAYYANYATLRPGFARVMRAYYDFVVRYMNVLSDRRLRLEKAADCIHLECEPMGLSVSSTGAAGAVWTILRSMPGYSTVSLINLTAATTSHWNAPMPPPKPLAHVHVEIRVRLDSGAARVHRVFTASPDVDGGASSALAFAVTSTDDGAVLVTFELPALHYWSLVVIETSGNDGPEERSRPSYA